MAIRGTDSRRSGFGRGFILLLAGLVLLMIVLTSLSAKGPQKADSSGANGKPSTTLTLVDSEMIAATIQSLQLEIAVLKQAKAAHVTLPSPSKANGEGRGKSDDVNDEKVALEEGFKKAKEGNAQLETKLKSLEDELLKLKADLILCNQESKKAAAAAEEAKRKQERKAKAGNKKPVARQAHVQGTVPAPGTNPEKKVVARTEKVPDTVPKPNTHQDLADTNQRPKSVGIDANEHSTVSRGTIPVIVFAYKREKLLTKAMLSMIKALNDRSDAQNFHFYISQDGTDYPSVTGAIEQLKKQHPDLISHLIHKRDTSGATQRDLEIHNSESYFAIAHHYQFAIDEVFKIAAYDRVILLEEDIKVAPDFFSYMKALSPLFDLDPDLYCVSGWNDNGKATLVTDESALYRSDFFPGLGWMMSRKLWSELRPVWPKGFWDDWMRQPIQRKGRSCIRPEVSRTFTWCSEEGVSGGQFCDHMAEMQLAKGVDWSQYNVSKLAKVQYDDWFDRLIAKAQEVERPELVATVADRGTEDLKVYYESNEQFQAMAQTFQLMDDFKDNVPRTAYKGVVTFRYRSRRVHLVARRELYQ
jgi:alpha-1,3-mannosyl-glycoprotein beta-1,2-N-acetylglucosaminyltransferase